MASLSKAASQEAHKLHVAEEEAARKRAARQAATNQAEPEAIKTVTVRVLPMGDGKISMGKHAAGIGEAHYDKGETFSVAEDIGQALEARGYVEIQGEAD